MLTRTEALVRKITARMQTCWLTLVVTGAGSLARAQPAGGDPLQPLTDFACRIAGTLQGGFGVAVALAVLGVGLLLVALGARGALGRVGIAVVATSGLVALPSLFNSLFPSILATACPAL